MVIINLKGGLGNQLYQYAAARALANQNDTSIWLDTSSFNRASEDVTPRKFELEHYALIRREDIRFCPTEPGLSKLYMPYTLALKMLKKVVPQYTETSLNFDQEIFNRQSSVVLDGYFQSFKYFQNLIDELRVDFQLLEPIKDNNKHVLRDICSSESVCLHVRRGDYITLKSANEFHGICDLAYYFQAIKLLIAQISNPKFFIFSDDILWCKQNFNDINANFVDVNSIDEAHLDINLMKNCKHFIIANSTFSWWPAWLSSYEKKIVIAPKRWFAQDDNINIDDRIPLNWIKI